MTTFVNGAPVFTLSAGAPVVEHDAVTTAGLVVATYSAPTDEEGDTVTVDFTAGSNGDGYYALNTATREVTLTATGAAFVNGGGALPTISLTATDNGTPSASSVQTATLVTTLVNDAPVLSVAVGAPVVEDAAATVDGLVVATYSAPTDEEGDTVTVGFTAGSNGDGYYALNTATREVTLTATGAAFVNGGGALPTISLTATDNGTPSASSVQTVTPVTTFANDAPVVVASVGSISYTEGSAAVVVDAAITVADTDSSTLSSATVSISHGLQAGDTLVFVSTATITGAYNAGTGVLTLTGVDTVINYQAALRSITFQSTQENPQTSKTISWMVNDGTTNSEVVVRDVAVTPVNDAPVITAGGTITYTENAVATVVSTTLTLSDVEGDTIASATASISANFVSGQDVLSFTPSGSITGSFDAGTGVLTLSGTGTTTEYQTVLRSVTYVNNSDDPSGAARTISFTATDSLGLTSGIASATVNVTPVNDAPLNAVTTSQVVLHSFTGTPLTGLSIADVDAGDATNLTATLAASDAASITIGSLSGGSTGGVSGGATIAGNGTATVTLTGSVAEINASLGGQNVVYKSADGFTSPTTPFTASTVTFTTNDAGNTGQDPGTTSNGTSEADVATIQVAVLPQVWFIDNTPPTSPSGPIGSQTNPFTSIEAFNDASALAGGPGANDYIYVQSGTYTGSGINLKDGQILLGADQALSFTNPFTNAVIAVEEGGGARPIIAVNVASDQAIDLASGNTIRGIHIVTVAGTSGLDDGTGITGGNVGNLTVSGMSITGAGQAVDIDQDGGVLNVVLETVSSSGGTHGIQLVGTSFTGTFSASGGMLSNHSVAELDLNGGAGAVGYAGSIGNGSGLSALISNRTGGTVTLSGDITDTNDVGGGISITSNSGGTITFSGANNVLNSGVANALQISGTAGTVNFSGNLDINTTSGTGISVASSSANVNFTGSQITVNATGVGAGIGLTGNSGTVAFNNTGNGLDIVTATGTGFSASGGGTVTVQGSSNTISSPNATALSVNGTTIGSSALLFQRVSSGNNDGGADPVNGIVLINTGNLGGLTITGAGTADSGGIIASSTGSAIVATNTQDLNLAWMSILNPSNHGIIATDLRGVNSLSDSKVSGFGAGLGNTTSENGFEIVNNNVNMTSLTVTNTTFSNAGGANDGIFMEAQGTSNMALSVINSNFSQFYGDAIQVNGTAGSNGSVRLIVKDSDFTSAVSSGNGGISMNPWGNINFFADINNNVFSGILNNVTTIGAIGMTNGMTADADVTIRNNDLDNIIGGRGITVTADGGTTDLLIDQNTIDGLGSGSKSAINISYTNNTGAGLGTVGTGNVTVSGNSIGQNGSPLWTGGDGSANAVLLQAMNGASMTALIQNNVVDANATLEVVRVRAASTVGNPGGTINATVTGNNIQDTSGTHVEFDATAGTSTLAGTVNLSVTGNTLNPSGVLQISEGAAGTINVAQANSAAVGTVNGDATVTVTGSPTFGVSPPSLPATPSLPLLARQGATGGQNADVLELATLQTMAEAAIARWVAFGIGAAQLQLLESVSFGVADLKGSILGLSTTGLVLIDSNAAGWGWFVDETPMADEEFPWTAEMAGNMGARMDLLTVLMHELGHIIGLADHYPGDWGGVMDSYLDVGQRHMSEVQLVGISPEEIGA
ncbi:hypothetical protein [Simplicispira metamorpha]|uniref:hypothetical protein n=1 Tax=Simplicispira metamorpha TaxID=80881 RepID=UPI00140516EC|nr:hypothetical protein [Simplicispira metamorpha]